MPASLLDGRLLAALRQDELKQRVLHHLEQGQRAPGLAVVLVGSDPASSIYVANKRKACVNVGIKSYSYDLPAETSQEQLLELIHSLNEKSEVDGILIQLPLPKHISESVIIEAIKPEKDVDGFHPYNLGRLAQRYPLLRPCTPMGVMHLLEHYGLDVKRKHALVIGASNIVGRPMSLELLLAGATVTVCHRFTQNLQQLVGIADFIIVATGTLDVINTDWLNSKQVLVDVGMHRLKDGSLRGDVDFEKAVKKVAWISPVPGGVGPMTIVSLLENTMMAAARNLR
jgi:methylenetetrahydrofolate dehydrogenase (NADP+)/methenyltetrahydrofolate cyclohydrolase